MITKAPRNRAALPEAARTTKPAKRKRRKLTELEQLREALYAADAERAGEDAESAPDTQTRR